MYSKEINIINILILAPYIIKFYCARSGDVMSVPKHTGENRTTINNKYTKIINSCIEYNANTIIIIIIISNWIVDDYRITWYLLFL